MSKSQKIRNFFLKENNISSNINSNSTKNFIRNISFILSVIVLYFSILGITLNITFLYLSLGLLCLYLFPLILSLAEKISLSVFKFLTITIIITYYVAIFVTKTENTINLFHLINIVIISFLLFDKKLMLFFSLLSLLILNLIYFAFNYNTQYSISEMLFFNFTFSGILVILFIFKIIEDNKALDLKRQTVKEKIIIEQEKMIIAFTLYQLRTTINNYIVFGNFKNTDSNSKKIDMEKLKEQSSESLLASLSLLENISKKENLIQNCNLDKMIDKIISFYKFNNKNIKITNYSSDYNFSNETKHQIVILKSLSIVFEIINQIIENTKTNIIFDYIEDKTVFSYKFIITKKNQHKTLKKLEILVLFEILEEYLQTSESNIQYSFEENKDTVLEINFNKKHFLIEEKLVKKDKEKVIDSKNYKLLLAEDDEINQKIYSIGFEKYFKKIDIAENGSSVLKKLDKSRYDLLVMDLQMPNMNGIETIEKIRELEQITGDHLLVIAITANTLIYNRQEILKFGFDEYFIKPFNIKKIYHSFINLKNKQHE